MTNTVTNKQFRGVVLVVPSGGIPNEAFKLIKKTYGKNTKVKHVSFRTVIRKGLDTLVNQYPQKTVIFFDTSLTAENKTAIKNLMYATLTHNRNSNTWSLNKINATTKTDTTTRNRIPVSA